MDAPVPTEQADQIALVEIIRRTINPGWKFFHAPNGGLRHKAIAAQLKAMGTEAGVPDLLFIGDRPPYRFALELKRRGRGCALTLEQLAWRDHLWRSGWRYLCTDDPEDAQIELYAQGIIRAQVGA